jgi:small multidrug resistance family-3 protein
LNARGVFADAEDMADFQRLLDPAEEQLDGPAPSEGFHPDRWDLIGAVVCLIGAAIILSAPRPA